MTVNHGLPQDAATRTGTATLTIERHDLGNSTRLTLIGEIDLATVPLLRQALAKCLNDGARTIHVDLTHTSFCDCCGLGELLHAHQRAAAAGASLHLHHPTPMVARLLNLTDTASILLAPEPGPDGTEPGPPSQRGRSERFRWRWRWGWARRIGPWSR
ncbi:STAS domain-containing protein [Streptacidiphilus rugosus]|uniref:STAS domain-containing protein n=1 Tax=Streptacidiphilus rugosus TaxID=405783 RepID=UPI0018DB61EC|nr:STAS domain-containing protein [Streptacidiphilus rugosus]